MSIKENSLEDGDIFFIKNYDKKAKQNKTKTLTRAYRVALGLERKAGGQREVSSPKLCVPSTPLHGM